MSRVVTYIDGFNLYYGVRQATGRRYLWLDLVALSASLLKPGQTLAHVHYFTARIRDMGDNGASVRRQSVYLDALRSSANLTVHEGHFLVKDEQCRACGAQWKSFEEKMSDVNLGVRLVLDASDDRFDSAILVTGDSDLTTPVREVRQRHADKRVVIGFPPRRNSNALQAAANGSFRIGEDKLRSCRLPDPVLDGNGFALQRPQTWR